MTPEQREAALTLAEKTVREHNWKKLGPHHLRRCDCETCQFSRALLSEHAENVKLREALEDMRPAGSMMTASCLNNLIDAALSGSPATED